MSDRWSAQSKVTATRDHLASRVGGQLVILAVGRGKYYGLNAVGARVWELIQETRSVGSLQQELLVEFDVTPEQLEADLTLLLDDLVREGLAQEVAAEA